MSTNKSWEKCIAKILMILVFVALSNCGCKIQTNINDATDMTLKGMDESCIEKKPKETVDSINVNEAIKLCQNKIGRKDDNTFMFKLAEKHTGRDIGYRCDGIINLDGEEYYLICMLWSDAQDVVWSSIGYLGVSIDGNEIYEVVSSQNNDEYLFGKRLWLKE